MPTITYTIPTAVQADFLDAMRDKLGMSNGTPAEIEAQLETNFKTYLKTTYNEYMRKKKTFDLGNI